MAQHLSPAARARARALDRSLDADRTGHNRNRDAAQDQLAPSHADPGSHTLPNTHGGRVGDPQPNQHTSPPTGAPPPPPAPASDVSPGAPPAAPTPTSPAPSAGGDGGGAGQGGSP
jgi:hypothetical protein